MSSRPPGGHQGPDDGIRFFTNPYLSRQTRPPVFCKRRDKRAALVFVDTTVADNIAADWGVVLNLGFRDNKLRWCTRLRKNMVAQTPDGQYAKRIETAGKAGTMDVDVRPQWGPDHHLRNRQRRDLITQGSAERNRLMDPSLQVGSGPSAQTNVSL